MNGFQYEIEFRGPLLFNLLEGAFVVYPNALPLEVLRYTIPSSLSKHDTGKLVPEFRRSLRYLRAQICIQGTLCKSHVQNSVQESAGRPVENFKMNKLQMTTFKYIYNHYFPKNSILISTTHLQKFSGFKNNQIKFLKLLN